MNAFKPSRYTDSVQYKCLEDLRESSMELSLIHCGKEKCKPLHIVQGKRDEIIIHFVFDGKGTFSVGDRIWHIEKGQMFILYPGITTTYISDADDPWRYAWIAFKGIHTENILLHMGFSKDNPVVSFDDISMVQDFIDKILDARRLTFGNDLLRNGFLLELLGSLCENHTNRTKINGGYDYSSNIYVNHAIEFISKFYSQSINVTSISEYIGITRAHLNNCFQKELGITVQSYLIDYRLHQASQLLSSTTASINEIAAKVGYPDPLAFSKAFKKKYKASPKFYRQNQLELLQFNNKQ